MEPICPIIFNESLKLKKSVEFSVPGKPRGKERPRTVRLGNRITTYTPKNTVEYENLIRKSYKKSTNIKLENTIEASITAIFPVAKSTSKKKTQELLSGNVPFTKKPDCDNIAKVVLDALNKVAYEDDSQVSKLSVQKIYGEEAMIKINLSEY